MKKILIASDDAVFRQVVSRTLCEEGAEIETASSESRFVELSLSGSHAVIITRYPNPFLCGLDLARRLKRRRISKPAIFLISHIDCEQLLLGIFESGVDQYMTLPLSLSRLRRKVRDELKKHTERC